jgi:hypothetical protein
MRRGERIRRGHEDENHPAEHGNPSGEWGAGRHLEETAVEDVEKERRPPASPSRSIAKVINSLPMTCSQESKQVADNSRPEPNPAGSPTGAEPRMPTIIQN